MPASKVITLFTDASRFADGASGWGAVIIADGVFAEEGGQFRERTGDILEAEVKAAAVGVHLAKQRGLLRAGGAVVLQIDSTDAIGVILASDSRYAYSAGSHDRDQSVVRRADHVPASCVDAVAHIRRATVGAGVSLYLRHVKGHKRGLSGRHNCNSRADKLARKCAQMEMGV